MLKLIKDQQKIKGNYRSQTVMYLGISGIKYSLNKQKVGSTIQQTFSLF